MQELLWSELWLVGFIVMFLINLAVVFMKI